jgi:hypothetical protein
MGGRLADCGVVHDQASQTAEVPSLARTLRSAEQTAEVSSFIRTPRSDCPWIRCLVSWW